MQLSDAIEFIYGKKEVLMKEFAETFALTDGDAYQFANLLAQSSFVDIDEEKSTIKLTELVKDTLRKDHGY